MDEIVKEAKKIIDDFMKELDKVKLDDDFGISRKKETRTEFEDDCDKEFRDLMFNNATKKKGDFILAEKKKW